ncbi:Enoyl-CoA hydratase/isomerase [Caldalkalibacillus thermarum TA2.A1]|uniref:Enoyl-CoA hydratase/isomerase n=2 Tax=Caldalkalibacillus thermarum (strain TA2.A1) TaxID=986075 RepID=F5L9G7_CALTT|nr:Enoyl-CoA hydratase/isomerase [Caldalkalibacillus thermarum TA2.A1]
MMSQPLVLKNIEGPVAILRLNRPQVLNALNLALMDELVDQLKALQDDDSVRAIILTGNEKAFAAGADIDEMADVSLAEIKMKNQFLVWDIIPRFTKPLIAAVQGYALGGGCELAMSCDMIIASENAVFGQPEINLGVMPGAGGTQRLTKALGKARAMEYLLTGKPLPARVAYECGLVTKLVPDELVMQEALSLAHEIAQKSPVAVTLIKEAVYKALDTPTQVGMDFERNAFYMCFGTEDRVEGMKAFQEKRTPQFKGR